MKKLSMKTKIILMVILLVSFGIYNVVFSQGMVQSATYNTMLKGLLSHSVPEKSVGSINKMIKSGTVSLLDTREKNEYDISHLKNSTWVGYEDFEIARLPKISKSDTIVVYCSVGYRSEKIAEKLLASGYKNVYNAYGGLFEWVNQDFPVYTSTNIETQKVHAYSKTWGIWLDKGEKVY